MRARARLAFYCHNVSGLGHVVRSLRIAEAALRAAPCQAAVITGCRFLEAVPRDRRITVERLPAVAVRRGGGFRAAEPGAGGDVMARRAAAIRAFLAHWRPHAVLVDHHPLGLGGELVEALAAAEARFAWGIPYAEGGTLTLRRPRNPRLRRALGRYALALAYTDPAWDDPLPAYEDYGLPARRVHVGFVTARLPAPRPPARPRVAALGGGGAGAEAMFGLLLRARARLPRAPELRLVVGPFGEAEAVARLAAAHRGVELWRCGTAEDALTDASAVVARAGYNTAFSVLAAGLPTCLVPFPTRDDEQVARARRLAELDGVWCVEQDAEDAEARLAAALAAALEARPGGRRLPFATDGAAHAARELLALARAAPADAALAGDRP